MNLKILFILFLASVSAQAKVNIAVTVDDLPVSGIDVKGIDRVQIVEKFTKKLKQNKVKGVYGFLNGIQAVHQAKRLEILKKWKEAGHYIGNHTWAHGGLSKLSVADYINEIEKNETLLIDFADTIKELKVFRYTYLEEGDTNEKRYGIRSYLKKRNYQVAQVTIDSLDWKWLEPFARCTEKGDKTGIQELKKTFIDFNVANMKYMDQLAKKIWGNKSIPHIYLLHLNAFTTDVLGELFQALKKNGASFVDSRKHIYDKFFEEDTAFLGTVGKNYIYQAQVSRKLNFDNFQPPVTPDVSKICL